MSFWNGTEWTSETPKPPIRKRPNRTRDWLATLVMVVALGVYALPLVGTNASPSTTGPSLTLSPTSGAAGTKVTVVGQAFAKRAQLKLTWDGATAGMPSFMTNARGSFRVSFKVPKSPLGSHQTGVTAPATTQAGVSSSGGSIVTSITADFNVTEAASATATPAPTADPTSPPDPTPAPTPKPTAAPTATPDPTQPPAPTPAPATPAPTQTSAPATPAPTQSAPPTPAPTTSPAATATAAPTTTPTPAPTATSAPTPAPTSTPSTKTVSVFSIPALLSALADNSVDEIVVANGTYSISGSGNQASNSLWIGSKYSGRTRPITVRAATVGGVTFDAGGGYMGGMSFNGGAHDQTWDGFRFANGTTSQTGVIVFGGYSGMAAPHNITLQHLTVMASCHRVGSGATDHAMYFSYALEGWHDILVEDFTVNATDTMGLASGIHMDHGYPSDAPNVSAHGVTVRRLVFNGNTGIASQQAIILWQPPTRDWLFDGATITNAGDVAIRYESSLATNIVFKDITSVNSGGFYSSQGPNPAGVTFINDVLH
jgi:hypothetical protein